MQSIKFNSNGGTISITLSAGQAQTGSYEFRLWEAGSNQMVIQNHGNFLNDDNDTYELPTPNTGNNGRLVQGIFTIALLPPNNNYSATMKVVQDGKTLGDVTTSGSSDQPSVILNLYASLATEEQSIENGGTTV